MELTIDKEFDGLFRSLTDDEVKALEDSLIADGCLDPIITWANHDDTILDGHNRYRLCQEHGIAFKTKAISLPDRATAVRWIYLHQLGRRNLDASQRSIVAAKVANASRGGDRRSDQSVLGSFDSQSSVAEDFDVSRSSVQRAKKVIEHGTAALTKAVQDGEIPVKQAAVIAELPKAEQRKVVAKGPEAVAAKVKEVAATKKYKDEFDTGKLDKELAKEKKPGTAKKQWEDQRVVDAIGQFAKQIDAAYGGFLAMFDECHAVAGGTDAELARARRAALHGKSKSHELLAGVTEAFRLWRPKK